MVDFKTDFVQTEEDVAQHAELYRGQLAAYSLALERVLEKAVTRKALYFLQAGKPWKSRDFKLFRKNRKKCLQSVFRCDMLI